MWSDMRMKNDDFVRRANESERKEEGGRMMKHVISRNKEGEGVFVLQ